MQRLTLSVPVASFQPGDGFHIYGNVDAVGRATDAIDYDAPLTGASPKPFWPLVGIPPGHLEGGWLQTAWLGVPAVMPPGHLEGDWLERNWLGLPGETPADHQEQISPLYFGWYEFAVITYDAAGNASSGEPATRRAFVNSGPAPPRSFKQSAVEAGRPVFSFKPPPQLQAA